MSTEIRAYDASDAPELHRLYGDAFGDAPRERFFERWDWEFGRSPAIERFANSVATRDGRVVAHLGLLPTRFAVRDQILPAAFLTDLLADADRGGVLALRLVIKSLGELPLVLHFGGAPVTKQIYERLGMRSVAIGESLVRVERPDGVLAAAAYRFLARRRPRLRALARRWLFRVPGALLLPVFAARHRWWRRLRSGAYAITRVDEFDERFDTLYAAMRRRLSASCVRDRAFLEWRYRHAPAGRYTALAAVGSDGQLAAASVLSRVALGPGSYGKLMECLYRDDDALAAIINASVAEFRRMRVDLIVTVGLSLRARELLREIGFRSAGSERPFRFKGKLSPEIEATLLDPGQWYISPGDGDEDFEDTIGA